MRRAVRLPDLHLSLDLAINRPGSHPFPVNLRKKKPDRGLGVLEASGLTPKALVWFTPVCARLTIVSVELM